MRAPNSLCALTLAAALACCAPTPAAAQWPYGRGGVGVEGPYPVRIDGLWGYVDRTGKVVIEPKYESEAYFSDGVAIVRHRPDAEAAAQAEPAGGTVAIPQRPRDSKWEIIDTSGKTLAEPPLRRYAQSGAFSEGLAAISGRDGVESHDVHGYIDKAGRVVIKPQFYKAGYFREGLADACVFIDRCGLIDRTGKFVVPPVYERVRSFSEGLALVITPGGRARFFDKGGEVVIALPPSSRVSTDFSEGLAAVAKGGSDKYGYIDKTGQFRIQPEFEGAGPFSEGLAPVKTNGRWGYVDREGRFVIAPQFAAAWPFNEGLAPAYTCEPSPRNQEPNGCGYGYIDKTGRFVVEQRFWYVGPFRDGVAYVTTRDSEPIYIDREGNVLWRQFQ